MHDGFTIHVSPGTSERLKECLFEVQNQAGGVVAAATTEAELRDAQRQVLLMQQGLLACVLGSLLQPMGDQDLHLYPETMPLSVGFRFAHPTDRSKDYVGAMVYSEGRDGGRWQVHT